MTVSTLFLNEPRQEHILKIFIWGYCAGNEHLFIFVSSFMLHSLSHCCSQLNKMTKWIGFPEFIKDPVKLNKYYKNVSFPIARRC